MATKAPARERWRNIPAGDLLDAFEAFSEHGAAPLIAQLEGVFDKIDAKKASPGSRAARQAGTTADFPGNGQGPTRKSETERSRAQPGHTATLKSELKRQGQKPQRRGGKNGRR